MRPVDNPLRGAFLVMGAGLMFASMGVLVRFASQQLVNEQVVFLRNLFGLLILAPVLMQRGVRLSLATSHPFLHLARGLFGLTAMYCFFYALAELPLAGAVLLNFTAPLFIPFIALLWLKERVVPRVVVAIAIGFCGILLILKPGSSLYSTAALLGLASGFFAAFAMVCLRKLSATEPPVRVVMYFAVIGTGVSAVPMLRGWEMPHWIPVLEMAAAGMFATAGQYLLSKGYGYAPAAQIGPFSYASVVFAGVYGWMFWGELPDAMSFGGALLVIAAGALAMQGRRRATTR